MGLTEKQKKYLKKHLRKKSIEKIASSLGVPISEIESHLQKKWGKEKYYKFLGKVAPSQNTNHHNTFSFKRWFIDNRIALMGLTMLVLITYINSLGNKFVSDDINGILKNPNLGKFKYIINNKFAFFHVLFPFIINKLFGRVPFPYHTFNVVSHLATVIALYFALQLLKLKKETAFIAAALFTVHPILIESVTWISGGYYCLSSFLAISSFSAYILSSREQSKKYYLWSVFFYFLALATSEKVIAFPLILLFYEISFGNLKKNWHKSLPFFTLSAIWAIYLLKAMAFRVAALHQNFYQPSSQIHIPLPNKLANFIRLVSVSTTSYLSLIFWPDKLTLYHSEIHFNQLQIIVRIVAFFSLIAATIWEFFKNKKVFFWLSWFFIALAPTLTPFGVSWIVAERYVYLASIGIFVLVAMLIDWISRIFKKPHLAYIIAGLLLIPLSIRTIIRNNDWKDQDHLWVAAARTSPSSSQNHNNLGDMYGRHGNLDKAIEEFKIAIKLNPRYADAYHNLANTYIGKKNIPAAIHNYQQAIKINPYLWQSYQSLAIIYFRQKKFSLAEQYFKKAISINPKNDNLHVNLGIFYLNLKKKTAAKQQFLDALKINPRNQKAKRLLLAI